MSPAAPRSAPRTFILFLVSPDSDGFRGFVPSQQLCFLQNFCESLSRLSDFVLLLCIICQIFVLRLFGVPTSRSHQYMYHSSSLHRFSSDSHTRSCATSTFRCTYSWSSRAAFSPFLSLRSCFKALLSVILTPSSTFTSSPIPSDVAFSSIFSS